MAPAHTRARIERAPEDRGGNEGRHPGGVPPASRRGGGRAAAAGAGRCHRPHDRERLLHHGLHEPARRARQEAADDPRPRGVRRRRGGRPGGHTGPPRRPRRRARDARMRRLLLVPARPARSVRRARRSPAPRRQPGERRGGDELGRRRHVRGEDARAGDLALPGRDRPARRPALSARLWDHDRSRRRPQCGQDRARLIRGGCRLRPSGPLDGAGRARRERGDRSSPSSRIEERRAAAPASSARPISWTRAQGDPIEQVRELTERSRRRLRARGGGPRRGAGAGVPDEPPGRHRRADRPRRASGRRLRSPSSTSRSAAGRFTAARTASAA